MLWLIELIFGLVLDLFRSRAALARSTVWTPDAQADLIAAALKQMGVPRAIVLGHSLGTLVAVALALKYPQEVQAVILASGYYYPNARADVFLLSPPAIPLIGDFLSHTVAPLLSRLMWPFLLRKIFGPSPVPKKFQGFPEEMAVRPSQIRASAAESALMIPSARALRDEYGQLQMPVAIVAGADDRFIESEQSAHLIVIFRTAPYDAFLEQDTWCIRRRRGKS